MDIFDITDRQSFLKLEILGSLRTVMDPEMGINIVDMGLVYSIRIEQQSIAIAMTLSSSHCPMGEAIVRSVQNTMQHYYAQYQTTVNLVWEPVWSLEQISEEGRKQLGL